MSTNLLTLYSLSDGFTSVNHTEEVVSLSESVEKSK